MTPYPHPAANLAVYKARLSSDIAVDDSTYTLQCGKPTPTATLLATLTDCDHGLAAYNTVVDMEAAGALIGEVDQYPYDRLNLADLPTILAERGIDTSKPFLKGAATTVQDLLDEINARWGTMFDITDIQALQIPTCDCSCGDGSGIGVALEANPLSLLYYGQLTIYVLDEASLPDLLLQPYISSLELPALTP